MLLQSPSLSGKVTEALTRASRRLGAEDDDIATVKALLVPKRLGRLGPTAKTTPFVGGRRLGTRWCLMVEESAEAFGWILAVAIFSIGFWGLNFDYARWGAALLLYFAPELLPYTRWICTLLPRNIMTRGIVLLLFLPLFFFFFFVLFILSVILNSLICLQFIPKKKRTI